MKESVLRKCPVMAWRPACLCMAVLMALPWLQGCHKPTYPGPQRLAPIRLAELQQRDVPPLEIPLDRRWRVKNGHIENTQEGLLFRAVAPDGEVVLDLDPPLDAALYNTLDVRMKIDQGTACKFSWRSDLDPAQNKGAKLSVPVLPGDDFLNYTFPLVSRQSLLWVGAIDRIALAPSDCLATTVIESLRLSFKPPNAPQRITHQGVTIEALYGSQAPWTLRVPHQAVFEAHVGMIPPAWKVEPKGNVRFQVTLDSAAQQGVVLVDRFFSPAAVPEHQRWVRVQADLSDYAGQDVTLHLAVDPCAIPYGDYAYWGNPIVFSREPEAEAVPVILISCDTLRADHLSCYGYERQTTPNLDRWATEEAVLFENAFTPEAYTLPSHMSMLTGLYPTNHRTTAEANLAESVVTLPELLREHGYISAGFTGHDWFLASWRGFAQGFDYYDDAGSSFRHIYETSHQLYTWMDAHRPSRTFLFFHNYDIHSKIIAGYGYQPYDPGDLEFRIFSRPHYGRRLPGMTGTGQIPYSLLEAYRRGDIHFSDKDHDMLRCLYDDSIRLVDQHLQYFLQRLRTQSIYDRALVILTADHGETLNDRGYYAHCTVHEEVCHVPLLVKFPNNEFAGQRYEPQVSLADIYATVQDVLGLPEKNAIDGQSLRHFLRGEAVPPAAIPIQYTGWHTEQQHGVRSATWKLVRGSKPELTGTWAEDNFALYDLEQDPTEKHNRYAASPEVLPELKEAFKRLFPVGTEGWHFRLLAPDSRWTGQLQLQAENRIAACYRQHEDGALARVEIKKQGPANVTLGDPACTHALLQTAGSAERLRITLTSETPFAVNLAGETAPPSTQFLTVLDHTARPYPRSQHNTTPSEPTVLVWHEEPGTVHDAADAPSEETRQALQALGYLE